MSVAEFTAQLQLNDMGALQLVYRMLGQPCEKLKQGYVYAFVSADMPHLVKIGRTINLIQRLREANHHDTYKPPSGFTCLIALQVDDMYRWEHELHHQFAGCRRKNANNHSSEFFQVDPLQVLTAFSRVPGIPAVHSAPQVNVREILHRAVKMNQSCAYRLNNPKNPGSKCHARYERYKGATTMAEALSLGTFEDIVYDYNAGFLKLD
jgi:hypothetical protein